MTTGLGFSRENQTGSKQNFVKFHPKFIPGSRCQRTIFPANTHLSATAITVASCSHLKIGVVLGRKQVSGVSVAGFHQGRKLIGQFGLGKRPALISNRARDK
jgi:hypothetical protein